jgi:hypothetical protein
MDRAIHNRDTEYQTELGGIRIKLAQYHEAIQPLKKAVELDPENVRAQELLEDAQAGRQRIDYVSNKKDANANANSKSDANSNSNSNTATNSNTTTRRTDSNIKSNKQDPPKPPTPNRAANRPN